MMKYLFLFLSVGLSVLVSAQPKKLTVTDFYLNELAGTIPAEKLPNYFADFPEKSEALKSFLDSLLNQKFNAQVDYYQHAPEIIYVDSLLERGEWIGYREQFKKARKSLNSDLYLLIRTYLEYSVQFSGPSIPRLVILTKMQNKKGKKIHKKTIKLPFHLTDTDSTIYTSALMSENAFFDLFQEGLRHSFADSEETVPHRVIFKPSDPTYDDFISASDHFRVKRHSASKIFLESHDPEKEMEIKLKRGWQSNDEQEAGFSSELEITQKLTLINNRLAEPWKIWMTADSKKFLDLLEISAYQAEVEIHVDQQRSFLKMTSGSSLEGVHYGHSYRLEFEPLTSLTKVYLDDLLTALIQPKVTPEGPPTHKVFIQNTAKSLPEIINLYTIFIESEQLLDEVSQANN